MRTLVVGWVFTVINFALFFSIGILIARWLGAGQYGDYAVAVAIFGLVGTAATLGLGKSSLNILSIYKQRQTWNLYHGYVRSGVVLILMFSVLLGLAFWGGFSLYEKYIDVVHSHPARALIVYFIPAAGILFFFSQVLIANDRFIHSVLIQRFQLPLLVLILIVVSRYFIPGFSVGYAIIAYGVAWVVCSITSILVALSTHESHIFKSKPEYKTKYWLSNAYPFLVNTLVINTLGPSTLIMLEILHTSESEIGIYAAAARTAILLVVLMKQSDRFFLPQIAPAIDTGDTALVNNILKTRIRSLGLLSLVFLIAIILFGRNILGLYGEAFVNGYHILLIFSVGIIIDILAGISLSILQIIGKNSFSLQISFLILISNIVLNIIFIPIYGLEAAVIAVNISIAAANIIPVIYLARRYKIRVV